MNLTEYKNQADPIANPFVLLDESDIKRYGRYTGADGEEYEEIKINGFDYWYDLHIKTGSVLCDKRNGKRESTVFNLRRSK